MDVAQSFEWNCTNRCGVQTSGAWTCTGWTSCWVLFLISFNFEYWIELLPWGCMQGHSTSLVSMKSWWTITMNVPAWASRLILTGVLKNKQIFSYIHRIMLGEQQKQGEVWVDRGMDQILNFGWRVQGSAVYVRLYIELYSYSADIYIYMNSIYIYIYIWQLAHAQVVLELSGFPCVAQVSSRKIHGWMGWRF